MCLSKLTGRSKCCHIVFFYVLLKEIKKENEKMIKVYLLPRFQQLRLRVIQD